MKTRNLAMLTAAILMIFQVQLFAQRGPGRGQQQVKQTQCLNIPDLTPEQQSRIETIRTERLAEATSHRAQMNELRAQRQSLRIADNPDMNQMNALIDRMARLRAQHMKSAALHHQSIREMLTPEQRVAFDARSQDRPRMNQRPVNRGQGRQRN